MNVTGRRVDAVVVGSGVAGSAAAAQLAGTGSSVLVLEREVAYTDRVRGVGMGPWGFEATRLKGLDQAILDAPGVSCMTKLVSYDGTLTVEQARRRATDLDQIIPGVPGLIAIGHPEMRAAVSGVAEQRGKESTVRRSLAIELELDDSHHDADWHARR